MKSFILLFLENYWVRKLEVVFAVVIATMVLSFGCSVTLKPIGKELLIGKKFIFYMKCFFPCFYEIFS